MGNENEEKIIEIIAELFNKEKDEVTRDKEFVNDFKAKSIQVIKMCAILEDEFDIEIDMEEARKNKDVGGAIDYTLKLIEQNK